MPFHKQNKTRSAFRHIICLHQVVKIREATDRFVHDADRTCNTRKNKHLHKTLRCISKNQQIKVCRMDKTVGAVIMNSDDYYQKLDDVVSDKSRFKYLEYDINTTNIHQCTKAPWFSKEKKVRRYCREYIKKRVDDKRHTGIFYRKVPNLVNYMGQQNTTK